jgi:chromate reductase, NAD(P)H dehydrogenase (quinone)
MGTTVQLLVISGSLRSKSTNSAALRTACVVAPEGVEAVVYDGLAKLPHFNPDDDVDPLAQAVAGLRAQIRAADGIMFSTPEHVGALPGSFKNLLDWTIGDDQPGSIYQKPVAWLNVSPHGAKHAHDSLRTVLGYASAAIVDAACAEVTVTGATIGDDGLIADPSVRDQLGAALTILAAHIRDRRTRE